MNGIKYPGKARIRSSTTMLFMALMQIMLLARTAPYNVDQCNYGTGEFFLLLKGTINCFHFTDGIITNENPDGTFIQVSSMNTCPQNIQYAYKNINQVEISTLLIISDWRNSESESTATLGVAFTDTDPSTLNDSALQSLIWQLDTTDMTKLYDFKENKQIGNYLILKYDCSQTACPKARIHQIQCYQEELVSQDFFEDGSENHSYNGINSNNNPWVDFSSKKQFLKENSGFSIDCNGSKSSDSLCSSDCWYSFNIQSSLTDLVSLNIVPGVDSSNSQDTSNNEGQGFQIRRGDHSNSISGTLGYWHQYAEQGWITSSQAQKVMSIVANSSYTIYNELIISAAYTKCTQGYQTSGFFILRLPQCLSPTYVYLNSGDISELEFLIPSTSQINFSWDFVHTGSDYDCQNDLDYSIINGGETLNIVQTSQVDYINGDQRGKTVTFTIDPSALTAPDEINFDISVRIYNKQIGNVVGSDTTRTIIIQDQCLLTNLIPNIVDVPELHAIIGQERQVFTLEDFSDTISMLLDNPINSNKGFVACGPRKHVFIEELISPDPLLEQSFIQLDISEIENQIKISYGSDDNSDAGIHFIQFVVGLETTDYELIEDRSVEFQLTLYQQLNNLTIDSTEYTLNSNSFAIEVPQLEFFPTSIDSFFIQAFLEGQQEDKAISAKFGVLSDDQTLLVIASTETSYIGMHRIKITYTGQDFMEGQQFDESFTLTVLEPEGPEIESPFEQTSTNTTESVQNITTVPPVESSDEKEQANTTTFKFEYPSELKYNPGYQIYEFVPKTKEEKQQEALRQKLNATASIDAAARVYINYEPQNLVIVPENWSLLYNQTNWQDLDEENRKEYEQLANKYLQVSFIQNSEEQEQASFYSNLTRFTQAGIQITLSFSSPLVVSAGDVKDQVKISLDENYFMVIDPTHNGERLLNEDLKSQQKYITFTQELPRLMPSIEEFESLEDNSSSASNILVGQFMSSFVLQVFLSGALSMLWNIFNTMQIIFALNLLLVQFPANVTVIYEAMNAIVNFEIVPKDKIYNNFLSPILDLNFGEDAAKDFESTDSDENDESQNFESLSEDFKGSSLVKQFIGFLTLIIALLIAIISVVLCRKYVIPRCPPCIKKLVTALERKLLFNSILRAVLEVYFNTCITLFISMRSINTYTYEGKINSGVTLMMGLFCFSLPYFVWDWLRDNIEDLDSKRYRQSFDSLYMNIEIDKGNKAIAFTFVFLVRRLLFAYVIGQIMQGVTIQIFTIYFLSCFLLGYYVSVMPMVDRINNLIQIFNELLVVQCTVWLFLFTNYVPDPVIQYQFAEYYIYIIGVNIAINLMVLILILLMVIIRAIRIKFTKYMNKQTMNRRVKPVIEIDSSESESSSSSSSSDSSRISSQEQELFSSEVFRQLYLQFLVELENKETNLIEELVNSGNQQNDNMIEDFLRCYKFEQLGYNFDNKTEQPDGMIIHDQQQQEQHSKKNKERRARFQVGNSYDDEDSTNFERAKNLQMKEQKTTTQTNNLLMTALEIKMYDQNKNLKASLKLKEGTFSSKNQNQLCDNQNQSSSEDSNQSDQISASGSAPTDAKVFSMHMKRSKEDLQGQALIDEYNRAPKNFDNQQPSKHTEDDFDKFCDKVIKDCKVVIAEMEDKKQSQFDDVINYYHGKQ